MNAARLPTLSFRACALAALLFCQGGWAEDGAAVPRFGISRFVVEGNSLLPADEVAAMLARHAGTDRTFSDIQRAVEDLEAAYRAAGYSTVSVVLPEQVLESGEIRLTVQETRLGKVHVSGQQHFDEANLRARWMRRCESATKSPGAFSPPWTTPARWKPAGCAWVWAPSTPTSSTATTC